MGHDSWTVSTVCGGQAPIASKWVAWKLCSFASQQEILWAKTKKMSVSWAEIFPSS